jgi:hypothetical protein
VVHVDPLWVCFLLDVINSAIDNIVFQTVYTIYTTKALKSKELTAYFIENVNRNTLQYTLKVRTLYISMNIKQTIRNLVLSSLLVVPVVAVSLVPIGNVSAEKCGNVDTAIIHCDQQGGDNATVEQTGLWGILILVINIMTAGVGVLALAGLVYGAVLYTSAGGSPEQIKKAHAVFTNVVIGVIAFGGMFTLLNFIVPGGVFN